MQCSWLYAILHIIIIKIIRCQCVCPFITRNFIWFSIIFSVAADKKKLIHIHLRVPYTPLFGQYICCTQLNGSVCYPKCIDFNRHTHNSHCAFGTRKTFEGFPIVQSGKWWKFIHMKCHLLYRPKRWTRENEMASQRTCLTKGTRACVRYGCFVDSKMIDGQSIDKMRWCGTHKQTILVAAYLSRQYCCISNALFMCCFLLHVRIGRVTILSRTRKNVSRTYRKSCQVFPPN